jgi:hypothetical protein
MLGHRPSTHPLLDVYHRLQVQYRWHSHESESAVALVALKSLHVGSLGSFVVVIFSSIPVALDLYPSPPLLLFLHHTYLLPNIQQHREKRALEKYPPSLPPL